MPQNQIPNDLFNLADCHAQGKITSKSFDSSSFFLIGGHLWKDYIPNADSIVFLADAADPIRFARAKVELDVCISFCILS